MNDSGLSMAQSYVYKCPGLAIYVDPKNNSTLQKGGAEGRLQLEQFPHVRDRNLAPCTGREVFQLEGAILNAPEPGHFMPQCLEQSSDFTVFPLNQHHFQM